jgi:hypothetical protein
VDSLDWALTIPPPVVPNIPASFSRTQDLTLTWTGGSAFPVVTIFGFAAVPITAQLAWVELICTADGSAGSFTIPSSLLSLYPSNALAGAAELGVDFQIAGIATNHFTGANAAGLDEGFFTAYTTNGAIAKIQ